MHQGRVNRPKPRKCRFFRKSQIEVLCSFSNSLSTRIVFAVKNHAESYVQGVRICIIRGDHVFRVRVGFRGKRLICDLHIAFADKIKPWSCETCLYKPSARKPWLTVYRAQAGFGSVLWILPPDPQTPSSGTTKDTKESIFQHPTSRETT